MERNTTHLYTQVFLHGKLNMEVLEAKDVLLPESKFIFALQPWALGHKK